MVNLNFPITPYPTGQATDPNFLQNSLGSFWNSIFSENGTIKGYTIAETEELLQAYQILTETIFSYGISDTKIFSKELWQPLIIQKSQLNFSPFIFQPNDAVFGPQPSADPLYSDQIFQFGFPKSTSQFVYAITPTFTIGKFSIIANRVFAPNNYYIAGVDVELKNNVLYFNKNPFDNSDNTITNIIGNNGTPVTYVDKNGQVQNDQLLILWIYNVDIDTQSLYNNFGYIFKINQPSSKIYKNILRGFFNIAAGGASILAIKSLMAYIGGIVPVVEPREIVQYVSTNENNQVVVTDKHSYLFDLHETILPSVIPGAIFYVGDTFTNLFSYYDAVIKKDWWTTVFANNSVVPFASYIFLGNYQFQLFFKNSLQLITLSPSGVLNFPIEGRPSDVQIFQNYINESANKTEILESLGLQQTTNPVTNLVTYPVNPLDFVFKNFFKNNTAVFVLNFSSPDQTSEFLNLFEDVKEYLPKHVYFMFLINVSMGTEIYNELNNSYEIAAYPGQVFNCDGSNQSGNIASVSPYFYNNLPIRLFFMGKAPTTRGNSFGLLNPVNLQLVNTNTRTNGVASCRAAKVFTTIPSGATTRTVQSLKLIDFS